jgi:hypothetical protein
MELSLRDFMSDAGVTKWVAALGVTDAPVPRRNIRAALSFFSGHMRHLKPEMALEFIRAMDLTKSVRVVLVAPGERLLAFRRATETPFKLFFARSGASPHRSGIDPTGRSVVHFVARSPFQALESCAAGANDTWSRTTGTAIAPRTGTYGTLAGGGGLQLIVAESYSRLLIQDP